MQRVRAHLEEHTRTVLDVLAQQLHREVLGLDEERIAALRRKARKARKARFQPLRAIHLPLSSTRLCYDLLLCQPLTHGVAQGQITREIHRIHPCHEWRNAVILGRHRFLSLPGSLATSVCSNFCLQQLLSAATSVCLAGRETPSAL